MLRSVGLYVVRLLVCRTTELGLGSKLKALVISTNNDHNGSEQYCMFTPLNIMQHSLIQTLVATANTNNFRLDSA